MLSLNCPNLTGSPCYKKHSPASHFSTLDSKRGSIESWTMPRTCTINIVTLRRLHGPSSSWWMSPEAAKRLLHAILYCMSEVKQKDNQQKPSIYTYMLHMLQNINVCQTMLRSHKFRIEALHRKHGSRILGRMLSFHWTRYLSLSLWLALPWKVRIGNQKEEQFRTMQIIWSGRNGVMVEGMKGIQYNSTSIWKTSRVEQERQPASQPSKEVFFRNAAIRNANVWTKYSIIESKRKPKDKRNAATSFALISTKLGLHAASVTFFLANGWNHPWCADRLVVFMRQEGKTKRLKRQRTFKNPKAYLWGNRTRWVALKYLEIIVKSTTITQMTPLRRVFGFNIQLGHRKRHELWRGRHRCRGPNTSWKRVRECFPGEKAAQNSGRIPMQLCCTIDGSQHQNIQLDKSPQH